MEELLRQKDMIIANLQPIVAEKPKEEEKEIHQTSLSFSGSCSSVFPSLLYEKVEAFPSQLRMPKNKEHIWTDEEEDSLLVFAKIVKRDLSYQDNKILFCQHLASMMNKKFQHRPQYVVLNEGKVKTKIETYASNWRAQPSSAPKQMYTSAGKLITGHDDIFYELFSRSEITSSGASSGSRKRKSMECTELTKREVALKYMIQDEPSVHARTVFAAARSPIIFWMRFMFILTICPREPTSLMRGKMDW